jgi:hypothetical protein
MYGELDLEASAGSMSSPWVHTFDFKDLGVTYFMHWAIAVPSTLEENRPKQTYFVELLNYVPEKHQFTVIYREEALIKWHERASSVTGFKDWLKYWEQAKEAIESTEGGDYSISPATSDCSDVQTTEIEAYFSSRLVI